MTKRNGILTHDELLAVAAEGNFIHTEEYRPLVDLDGTEARRYLESKGFTVVANWDCGRNGWALTREGVKLSTNGYIYLEEVLP